MEPIVNSSLFPQPEGVPNLELFAPPEKTGAQAEAEAVVTTLDPPTAAEPSSNMDRALSRLADINRETTLQRSIDSGEVNPDMLNSLRNEYGLPDPDEAVVGAVNVIAEPDEDVSDVKPAAIKQDRADFRVQMATQYGVQAIEGRNVLELARDFTLSAGETLIRGVVPTGDFVNKAEILARAVPELKTLAYADFGGAVLELRRLQDSGQYTQDEVRKQFEIMDAGISEAASFGYYSVGQADELRDSLFSPLARKGDVKLTGAQGAVARAVFGSDSTDTVGAVTNTGMNAVEVAGDISIIGGALAKLPARIVTSLVRAGIRPRSGTGVIARTEAGAKALWAHIVNRASDAPLPEVRGAATTEDIMASFALPKIEGQELDSTPVILSSFIPEAQRDALAADPEWLFGAALVPRIQATTITSAVTDSGAHGSVQLGTKKGLPFKTQPVAEAALKREFGGEGKVVAAPNGTGHVIEIERTRQWGLPDVNEVPDLTSSGHRLWKWFGKNLGGTEYSISSSNIASRQGTRVQQAVDKELMRPFWSLPVGSQRRVATVLDKGDLYEYTFRKEDLYAEGLNDAEIVGYAAARRLVELDLSLTNTRLWHKYSNLGYRGLFTNGQSYGLKVLDDVEEAVRTSGSSRAAIRAVDLESGAVTDLVTIPPHKVVARLMTPTPTGERFAIVARQDLGKLSDLPNQLVPSKAGYIKRPYKYPYFVKAYDATGAQQTLKAARSQLEADELVAEFKLANPKADIRAVASSETRQIDDLDELDQLHDAGLLWNSTRSPSRLTDPSGGVRMVGIEDRLRMMQGDIAHASGLQRWGDVQKIAWNQKYGKMFDRPFNPGTAAADLQLRNASLADGKLVEQARRDADFINNTLGVGNHAKKRLIGSASGWASDRFFNMATRAERYKIKPVASVLRWTGENIIGLSGKLLSGPKSAVYALYIATAPLTQLPLQMTLALSYAGVRHGGLYLTKGAFSRDFAAIMAGGMFEGGSRWAGKLGADKDLWAQWQRSGIRDSIAHHQYSTGVIGDIGAAQTTTRLGRAAGGVVNGFRAVGVDLGAKGDALSSWLFARNRWIQDNPGKVPTRLDERAWETLGSEISGNPTTADSLPFSGGLLGAVTQFQTMQVKQAGRTFQAIPGVPTGSLGRVEAARMAAINLLTYGVAGFGVKELAQKIVADNPDLTDGTEKMVADAQEVLAYGLANYMLNDVLDMAFNEKGENNVAFTERFSPNNIVGGGAMLPVHLTRAFATGDWELLANMHWQAPVMGLSTQITQAAKFTAGVLGAPTTKEGVTDSVKFAAIARRWSRVAPGLSNPMKALACANLRAKFNGRGDPVAEAALGECFMALTGTQNREEAAAYELSQVSGGGFGGIESDIKTVRDHAYDVSQWLFPLLDEVVGGKVTYEQAQDYIYANNDLLAGALSPSQYADFQEALGKAVDKRWTPKYDKAIEDILYDVRSGKLALDEDGLERVLRNIPDAKRRDEVRKDIRHELFGE